MDTTQQIPRRYHDAWKSGDSTTVAALLSPDFQVVAADPTIAGRDAFLDT